MNSNFAEGVTAPVICPSRGISDVFYRKMCLKQVILHFPCLKVPIRGYIL